MSVGPPAANGTMSLIGLTGYAVEVCAGAAVLATSSTASASVITRRECRLRG
jgi:hypothetical protein